MPGEHTSRFTGLGVEYESVREYQYGDDERRIDWNITARTPPKPDGERTLFIKQLREERNLDVLLVIDQSGSMEYRDKVLTAVRAALVIADMAQRRSDYVGLVCFRDKVEVFLPPTRSTEQAYRILKTLCMSYRTGGASHLKTMAAELVRGLRRRTIVNLITDINHEVDEYAYFSHLLRTRGHITNLLLIADESELNLPDVGWLTLMESEELRKITIDTSEFKTEYDTEVHSVLMGIMSGCKMFGTKIFLFRNPREVDYKITEIANYYRLAREYAYR